MMRPIEIQPLRPMRANDEMAAPQRERPAATVANDEKDVEVSRSELLDSSPAPVDAERVAQIRQAIAEGTYPLVPARIADAMIAAGLLLRNSR